MPLEVRSTAVIYEQTTPSMEWVIVHNLGTLAPAIDIWIIDAGETIKILASTVVATDANTVTLTFSSPRSGKAIIA